MAHKFDWRSWTAAHDAAWHGIHRLEDEGDLWALLGLMVTRLNRDFRKPLKEILETIVEMEQSRKEMHGWYLRKMREMRAEKARRQRARPKSAA